MFIIESRRNLALNLLRASDLVVFGIALLLAWFYNPFNLSDYIPPVSWTATVWLLGSLVIWHYSLAACGLYRSRRLSGPTEYHDALKGASIGAGLVAIFAMLLDFPFATLQTAVTLWAFSAALTLSSRVLLREALGWLRKEGRNLRHIVIVGSGARARQLLKRLEQRPDLGYRIVGWVDDIEPASEGGPSIKWLGNLKDLNDVLAQHIVDEVFVTLPMKSFYDSAAAAIRKCHEQGIPVRLPLDLFDEQPVWNHIDILNGMPVLSLASTWGKDRYEVAKRVLDVVAATCLLVVLAPVGLLIAGMIKLDSPGPVFFAQKRVGRSKRTFGLYKFRTMVQDGEAMQAEIAHLNEASGPVFKIRNDPRVTRVGKWLRKTSIDELPQLINVLKGEMSLVGPRPLPVCDVEGFTVDWQRRRFSVKPGITCLWQISGRSNISFDQWMELDMAYIDERNLWLDFKILLQTVPVVFRGTGAY